MMSVYSPGGSREADDFSVTEILVTVQHKNVARSRTLSLIGYATGPFQFCSVGLCVSASVVTREEKTVRTKSPRDILGLNDLNDLKPSNGCMFGNKYRLCTVLPVGNTAKYIVACGTG